jgi:hypothetical protein
VPDASVVRSVDDTQSGPGVRRGLVDLRAQGLALELGEELFAPRDGRGGLIVASCEEALARFGSEALSAELDEPASDVALGLRAVDAADD